MSFIIGVDIGGTNTDVAIVQGNDVIGWNKSLTTSNIIGGVVDSIKLAAKNAEEKGFVNVISNTQRVNIGTTQFINAVINRNGLEKIAAIRLCGITSHSLPPFSDFPDDLREQVSGGVYLLNGGLEFDGKVITDLNENEVNETLKNIVEGGIKRVAVSAIFSPSNPCQEKFVQEIIEKKFPQLSYTLSSNLGRLGLLERENATILNESLKTLCENTVVGFKDALQEIGLHCMIYFTQNDGTLLSEKETLQYPVLTFSSGATNSMRGAAYLSSVKDAVIVDIGGTTTDVGVLMNGFPRESSARVKVGGVNINFRMPDTISIGVGGGSIVTEHTDGEVIVGPSSVGYRIAQEALIFGGKTMVASDVAVASGLASFGNKESVGHLSTELINSAMRNIKSQIEIAVDAMKLSGDTCSLILVGGGSVLIDPSQDFHGASDVKRPNFYQVANAVGAAISQVSGTFDEYVVMDDSTREEKLKEAKASAIDKAVENGATRDSCQIVEISELQIQYMALPYVRLSIKAVGELENFAKPVENVGQGVENKLPSTPCINSSTTKVNDEVKKDSSNAVKANEISNKDVVADVHTPEINEKGEWVINEWDVDCLAIGAGILGCGGGGSTYLGRLKLMECLRNNKRPRIIHPFSMPEECLAYSIAYIGAPEVFIERISDVSCLKKAMQLSNELLLLGFNGGMTTDEVIDNAKSQSLKYENVDKETLLVDISNKNLSMPSAAVIMSLEIGGTNALEPLIVAAELDIPALDCDGMGRAFPQLQHFTPFMYDVATYPAVITGIHGNSACCVKCGSTTDLENLMRGQCVKMGLVAGFGLKPFSRNEVLTTTCHFTLSHAWYIGNAVKNARQCHKSPTAAIIEKAKGAILCQGKISDIKRETKDGFTWGKLVLEGNASYINKDILIEFQNEFIIARSSSSNKVLATVPDLITVVDTDTGEPIMTSEVRYGLRITALVLPAMPLLTTPKALEFVGPRGFKLQDVEYNKICEFGEIIPIPKN